MESETMCGSPSLRRRRKPAERGQMLTLVVLIMGTFLVLAIVPITVGQTLVRRKQAQMIVDAAALAGAQQQAKGLNTIARLNEKAFGVLNGIIIAHWTFLPPFTYYEKSGTVWGRIATLGQCCPDWVKDMWGTYHDAFDAINTTIDRINFVNSNHGYPRNSARRVIDENFGGTNTLFHDEQPLDHGVALFPNTKLVKLTEPGKYKTGGFRLYAPVPNHWSVTCSCTIAPWDWPCCAVKAAMVVAYVAWNLRVAIQSGFYQDGESYEVGKFYDNAAGSDVRFSYYLAVEGATPVLGKTWFNDIPPIVVVATAKPFGGHLGAELRDPILNVGNLFMFPYRQQDNKEMSYTYKAKLVETRYADRAIAAGKLAIFGGEGGFDLDTLERWTYTVTH